MDNKSNTGNYNSGYCNSGYCNSGYYNSGDCNSGDCNSGDYNSGDCNSGDHNSGDCNSGFFNTSEPTARLFNKDTSIKVSDINIPHVNLKINEWVYESDMTDEQKDSDKDFHVKKGTLIKRTYKEAWAIAWEEMEQETKDIFLALPNFCPEIFKEITGVDVNSTKKIIIDGKEIEISEESYNAFKEQFKE